MVAFRRSGSVGASEELGRGRRSQAVKRQGYADLTERQFNYLLREGSLPPSAFKKRARSEDKQDSGAKKQKKDPKASQEASSRGPEPAAAGKRDVDVDLGGQGERSMVERHVARPEVAGQLPDAVAATLDGGRAELGRDLDGAGALPRVGAQIVPAVGPQTGFRPQPGSSAEAPGKPAPSGLFTSPPAVGPTASHDSDEDLPLCALRAPAPKKSRHGAATKPLPKPGPSNQPVEHVSIAASPAAGAQGGVPQKQYPAQAPGEDASRGQKALTRMDSTGSGAPPQLARRVSETVTETFRVIGPAALKTTPPDSEIGGNGQVTGTPRPGVNNPGSMLTGSQVAANSQALPTVLLGSSGGPAESGPAGKLQPLQGTVSPPSPVAAPENRASDPVDGIKSSTPHSAAAAPPVGHLDSGGAPLKGVNKPRDPGAGGGAGTSGTENDGTGSKSLEPAGATEEQPHGVAAQPPDATRLSGDVGNGVTAKGFPVVRSEVPRKGFKRRRTHCQTAEEAFEWSEEDVEEPSQDTHGPSDGPGVSAKGTPASWASPPTANGGTAGLLSGRAKANGSWSAVVLAGKDESQPLSPSFASRPEVVRVTAAARGGLDGGEPWTEALFEKVPSENGIKVAAHGEPARSTSHGEANSRGISGTASAFRGFVRTHGLSRQGSPALSSPTSARNPGALASPTVCNGRGDSQSPRVGERNERATPDSVVSEASLRAAHSAVGTLLDSMEEDGDVPCKKWLF